MPAKDRSRRGRVASVLGVEPSEARSTVLMLAHSFFMGTATVFFETAASALFLAQYGSQALPYVYIVAAVLNTGTGFLYSEIKERVSFATLMLGTVAFLLVSVIGFRVGLALSSAAWVAFGLLVWYRVISILTDLEYWAVATRLYDVRQAKRLFGLIGSGEVVARIVGSFSVPLLVTWIGVVNLLLVSAAGLAFCLVFVALALRGNAAASAQESGSESRKAVPVWSAALMQDRYLLLLLSLSVFGVLGKYFVDYAFLEQMKERYADVAHLAGFFGMFSGISQVLSLLTRVFLSGRIISRYGIRLGLLVLPVIHVLCTLVLVLNGALFGQGPLIFWLVVLNQGIYKTLKHPIDNPSFKVLYQPLRKEQRLAAQIAVEVIVTPITIGVAGAVMLFFNVVIPYDPVAFSLVLLATFGGWLYMARLASREYPTALTKALRRRTVDNAAFALDDEASRAIVRERIRSEDAGDVIFALHLLERLEEAHLKTVLPDLLTHPAPEVRRYVLALVERLGLEATRPRLEARLADEGDPTVRAALLQCLAALGGEGVTERIAPYLSEADLRVRRGALVGLLRSSPDMLASAARVQLAALTNAADPKERNLAAQVIADVGRPDLAGALEGLLTDPDPDARRAALVAAGRIKSPALWPRVAVSLGHPLFNDTAAGALIAGGEAVVPDLRAAFAASTRPRVLAQIAHLCGRIPHPSATAFLLGELDYEHLAVREAVVEALSFSAYHARDEVARVVRRQIHETADEATWALAAILDIGEGPEGALLRNALEQEVERSRSMLFLLLSLLFEPSAILRARDNLGHGSGEKRAYALEILDVVIETEMSERLTPLLRDMPLKERWLHLGVMFPQARCSRDERIQGILERPDRAVRPWTKACAAYTAAQLQAPAVLDAIRNLSPSEPFLRETALWAEGRLRDAAAGRPGEKEGPRAMLAIEKVMILKSVQMFAETPEEVLAEVAAIVEEIEVAAGKTIIEKGDVGDSMYIIVEGRVRVHDSGRTINELGEKDIFGELALLDPEPRAASVTATEDTRLFRLDRTTFTELMAGNIEIVRGILHVLCERLRHMIEVGSAYPGSPS